MGPQYGTPEYKQQVEMISAALRDVPMAAEELPFFLMMYVTDCTVSRAAICEAEKKIKTEHGWS